MLEDFLGIKSSASQTADHVLLVARYSIRNHLSCFATIHQLQIAVSSMRVIDPRTLYYVARVWSAGHGSIKIVDRVRMLDRWKIHTQGVQYQSILLTIHVDSNENELRSCSYIA